MPEGRSGGRKYTFRLARDAERKRLDTVVCTELQKFPAIEQSISRSRVSRWIERGLVRVNAQVVKRPAFRLTGGESVVVTAPQAESVSIEPDSGIALDILFEDSELLVLNKPPGIVVHPGAGRRVGTLVHGILSHLGADFQGVGDALRPGIVHRLDKDTSGVLVVCKTDASHLALSRQFAAREVKKIYLALVTRLPGRGSSGRIELGIRRHPAKRTKMIAKKGEGRQAVTNWRVVEEFSHGYLLEVVIETGRTHQIRAHLAACSSGVVGDPDYGSASSELPLGLDKAVEAFARQALHAWKISFVHPGLKRIVSFEAPLPKDMSQLLEQFRGT